MNIYVSPYKLTVLQFYKVAKMDNLTVAKYTVVVHFQTLFLCFFSFQGLLIIC